MSSKSTEEKNKPPSTLQKSLAFAAVLLLCALIYLLVSLQESRRTYALALTPVPVTPTATPAPTLPPGVSEDVFLSRLEDAGFTMHEEDGGDYLIRSEEDGQEDLLVLYAKRGYVQGFSLTMQEEAMEKVSSPKGDISKYLADKRDEAMEAQAARITELLPTLLAAMTEENEFPHSTALIWADEAGAVLESGKAVNESKHGISFAALRTQQDQLLISTDIL